MPLAHFKLGEQPLNFASVIFHAGDYAECCQIAQPAAVQPTI